MAGIEAAKAGAAVAHIHVRDPETGQGSRDPELYKEVVDRIRSSETDVVINLTGGMGGDLYIGPGENPLNFGNETDMVGALERLVHIEQLMPSSWTLAAPARNMSGVET